jgi:hypothetical protein
MHLPKVLLCIASMSLAFTKTAALFAQSQWRRVIPTRTQLVRSFASASGSEDTVVATCTKKISDLLKPMRIKVTSSNDDPNGSHVSLRANFFHISVKRSLISVLCSTR